MDLGGPRDPRWPRDRHGDSRARTDGPAGTGVLDPDVLDPDVLDPDVLDPDVLDPDVLDPDVLVATYSFG